MLQEELDGRLERALLSSLDLRFGQVSTDSEPVLATCKVLPLVQFRILGSPPRMISAFAWASAGNLSSSSQELIRRGTPVFLNACRDGHDENHGARMRS